jgi:serine/threonine protein kinase
MTTSLPPDGSRTFVLKSASDSAPAELNTPLVSLLAEFQAEWRTGGAPRVETVFQRNPELLDCPEAGLRLIYEEICQRRAFGEEVSLGELYNRFPRWYSQLLPLLNDQSFDTSFDDENAFFPTFEVMAELGHGSGGRVYLARQTPLGKRLVVLKVIPSENVEHLSLARLQHTNIVPLYGVFDDPNGKRRALCMPYFGSTTLFHIFDAVASIPIGKRRGRDILNVLESREREVPILRSTENRLPPAWADRSYVAALCHIGAALAQALADAHSRGLLHLDIKPSNVLLTDDGQPMLLDFHLARAPMAPGDPPPLMFGGTPPYMSPEQDSACTDVTRQCPISVPMDARADIYSLGMLLYVGLADGPPPAGDDPHDYLRARNPEVSVGLADILMRCVAEHAADRYANAKHLAEDLRRHIYSEPLHYVPNRSWGERWRKWRHRRPYSLIILVLALGLSSAIGATLIYVQLSVSGQRRSAESMFMQGQAHLQDQRFSQAAEAFTNARDAMPAVGAGDPLLRSIERGLATARRAQQAKEVTDIVDAMRLAMHSEPVDYRTLIVLDVNGKDQWSKRGSLLAHPNAPPDARFDAAVRRELTELALDWADIHMRIAPPGKEDDYRDAARAVLDEARAVAPSPRVIDWWLAAELGEDIAGATGWEWYCLGRTFFRRGDFTRAAAAFEHAVAGEPADYWSNFALGDCALRQSNPRAAVAAFSVCVGQRPQLDVPYVRRGRAYAALGQWEHAIRDLDRALQIRPNVTDALIERGRAHLGAERWDLAKIDLEQALDQGGPADILQPLLDRVRKK